MCTEAIWMKYTILLVFRSVIDRMDLIVNMMTIFLSLYWSALRNNWEITCTFSGLKLLLPIKNVFHFLERHLIFFETIMTSVIESAHTGHSVYLFKLKSLQTDRNGIHHCCSLWPEWLRIWFSFHVHWMVTILLWMKCTT